jgi:hypothetical protein
MKINEEKDALTENGREQLLFCSLADSKKCTDDSVWFTYNEFAKYLVSYKTITFVYTFHNIKFLNGTQESERGFVVYTKTENI